MNSERSSSSRTPVRRCALRDSWRWEEYPSTLICHLTCVFLKHCGQKTLCAELYKTRHEEDADRRGLASDRHSPGPLGLIFGQKYWMGVCIPVSADFRGYTCSDIVWQGFRMKRMNVSTSSVLLCKHAACVLFVLKRGCWVYFVWNWLYCAINAQLYGLLVRFRCNVKAWNVTKTNRSSTLLRFAVCWTFIDCSFQICAEMQFVTGCVYAFFFSLATSLTLKIIIKWESRLCSSVPSYKGNCRHCSSISNLQLIRNGNRFWIRFWFLLTIQFP